MCCSICYHDTFLPLFSHLFLGSKFNGLNLLRPVLVVVEIVPNGERLEQLHGGLRAHLGHPIEEEDLLGRLPGVVQLCGVQLKGTVGGGMLDEPSSHLSL